MEQLASIRRTRLDKTLDVLGVPPFDARGDLLSTEDRLDLWASDPQPRWFTAPPPGPPARGGDRCASRRRRSRSDRPATAAPAQTSPSATI